MERRPTHTKKKTHTTRTDTDRDTQRAHREHTRRRDGYNKRHVALLAPPTTSSLHDASYSRRIVVVVPLVVPSFKPHLFPSSLSTPFTTTSSVHSAFVPASSVSASSVLASFVSPPLPRFIFNKGSTKEFHPSDGRTFIEGSHFHVALVSRQHDVRT